MTEAMPVIAFGFGETFPGWGQMERDGVSEREKTPENNVINMVPDRI